ncbi:hypothetical protein ES703_13125 [subsurface metagenome]
MTKRFTSKLREDENGNLWIDLPPEIVELLEYKEGDALVLERTNRPGRLILRKPRGKPPDEQPAESSSS